MNNQVFQKWTLLTIRDIVPAALRILLLVYRIQAQSRTVPVFGDRVNRGNDDFAYGDNPESSRHGCLDRYNSPSL